MEVVKLANGTILLKIRCPWENSTWKGAWSKSSREWTPETKKELNVSVFNGGSFFMSLDDVISVFSTIHIVRNFDDSWHKKTITVRNQHPEKQIVIDV